MANDDSYEFRLISNNVRFGYGKRMVDGHMQYFAFHGFPNRNDDYFTNVEITEEEFHQIEKEYPEQICANGKEGLAFRNKYVDGHPVILEGWDRLL